jgi:LPS-assembly protein
MRNRILLFIFAIALLAPVLLPCSSLQAKEASTLQSSKTEKGEEQRGRVEADRLETLEQGRILEATGNVYLTYGQVFLRADHVRYDRETEDALAEGGVFLTDGKSRLEGDRLEYNTSTGRGILYRGNGFFAPSLWVKGMEIRREDENTYSLTRATLTPCPVEEGASPDWEIRAKEATVHVNEEVVAHDASLWAKGIPLLYSPLFTSPAGERKSGFLIPESGVSTSQGFFLKNAYFWAISPSQDATFGLNYRSERGLEGLLEYRYILSEKGRGQFDGTYAYDFLQNENRWKLSYQHEQEFQPDLNGKLNVNLQKTRDYQRLYNLETNVVSQRLLTSEGYVAQTWPHETLMLWGNFTQDLAAPDYLFRLPELNFLSFRQPWERLPLYFHLNSAGTYFAPHEQYNVGRFDVYPRLTCPLNLGGFATFTPLAAFRETFYTRDERHHTFSREIYQLQARLDSRIFRTFQLGGGKIEKLRHVIEPMVAYEYIPEVNQTKLETNDVIDHVSPQNGLTYSLTNRILARVKGGEEGRVQELLIFRLSQSYNIHRPHDRFPYSQLGVAYNELRGGLGLWNSHRRFSDINGHLVLSPARSWSLAVDANYDPGKNHMDTIDPYLRFQFPQNASAAVGYHYAPELKIQSLEGKFGIKYRELVSLTYFTSYDFNQDAFRENNVQIAYFGPCWSISLGFIRRLRNDQYQNSIQFNFDLRSISGIK